MIMVKIKQNKKLKLKSAIIGSLVALIIFFIFGIVTVLIKNPFFSRMTSVYWYDYVSLVLTSFLSGAYIGLWHYNKKNQKNINSKCDYAATGGAVGGFFSFGCAVCNKLLISVYLQLKTLSTSNKQTKADFIHYEEI